MDEAALFQGVMATAGAPIIVLTGQFRVSHLNPEAQSLWNVKLAQVRGQDFFGSWSGGGIATISRDDLQGVLAGGILRGVAGPVVQADGTERFILWNAGLAGLDQIVMVGMDVTDFHRAEEALREREARMTSIIATAPDAIVTIDEQGIIQSFSHAAQGLFGYSAAEVIGRSISLLMPSPHNHQHDSHIQRYLHTAERHIIGIGRKIEAQHKDGTIFPVELAVGEVQVGNTRIFTGFIRDLTARVHMEDELRQVQKMEAIGQLTGGVAHDFNNILTVITGNLELLETGLADDDQREIVAEAQEAAQLGANLSHRLLAFGRRQPLNPKPLDLSALVLGMVDLLQRTLGSAISVEPRLTPNLPLTIADPGQIENALLNLAINSRDAMPTGGKLIIATGIASIEDEYVAHHLRDQAGRYVSLFVTDTGNGMAPDVRARAFDPFFTTKGPGRGTGLGLSSVYGLVKQSGGSIQLLSDVGVGTTVKIYLPPADFVPHSQDDVRAVMSAPPSGATVLVVEDDPRVRKISVRRIAEMGYRVLQADRAATAWEVLEAEPDIDILFTDVMMPGGMSGVDLARRVRERWPALRILLTSGYADPHMVKGEDGQENFPWINKPYSTRDLARKLRDLVATRA